MRGPSSPNKIRSSVAPAAVLAVAAMALTACTATSGGSPSSSSSTATSTSASQNPTSTSGGTAPTNGSTSTSTPTPTAGSTAPTGSGTQTSNGGSALAACATSQLKVAQVNPSLGAGQYYSTIVFTNTSGTTCTLAGFPGVSYVVANGVQSGPAAVRSGGPGSTVTLKPGGTASSVLHDSNGISGYTPQQCDLTKALGLRIYPPNQKAALFIPWVHEHCAGKTINPLSIGPVTG